MNTSPTIGAIAKALAAAQAEIENVTKDKTNPAFKSQYATLAAVLDVCRPVLSKHGIALIQSPGNDGNAVTLTTTLAHESGEYMSSTVGVVPGKFDAQGLGSAVTYLRRYALAAICGVAQEDDDGNAASNAQNRAQSHDTQRGQPATAPTTQTRPVAQPAKSDPFTTAKASFRSMVADLGAEEEHADTLRMLDQLTPDDFRPVYNRLKEQHAALSAKGN